MSPVVLQAIGVAAGALILAVLGYCTAAVQAHTREIAAQQALLAAAATPQRVTPSRASDRAGAGAVVRHAPLWNQLADPLPDGTLPAQRFNECGEECCAMEISRQHGVPLSADALRFLLGGPGRGALTTAQDLVRALALCNVPATARDVAIAGVAGEIQSICSAGGSVMALGNWVDPAVLHWILVTRADGQGCSANDPWGGRRRSWGWAAFQAVYAGELVRSMRAPDAA